MKRTILQTMGRLLLACFAVMALQSGAVAQDFPSRPIKFVVPFPPGSATDTSARYFGRKITDLTGQPVVVDNKPGANSMIAIRAIQSAPADGYTVFIGSNSPLAVNAALFKQLPYDPVADFTPLSLLTRVPGVLIVPADSPFKTVADLVAAAKAQPGKLNFGFGSAGYQLMGELFNEIAGTQTTGIPFKSATDSVTAVAADTVNFAFVEISSTLELVRGGKIRALAIASPTRSSALPQVPTAHEAGITNMSAYAWVAAVVASRTPKAETEKLAELFARILAMPETQEFYAKLGGETTRGGIEELRRFQQVEIALWKRVVSFAKVPLQ